MTTRIVTRDEWQAQREAASRRCGVVDDLMPAYVRERPRDANEARLLRDRRVPERFIGPVSDERREREARS